jgi:hypothetical protein
MTQLVEDITIKITLNHCEGDSEVLGKQNNLRCQAYSLLGYWGPEWAKTRALSGTASWPGIEVKYENTGLYEAPETGGGDN